MHLCKHITVSLGLGMNPKKGLGCLSAHTCEFACVHICLGVWPCWMCVYLYVYVRMGACSYMSSCLCLCVPMWRHAHMCTSPHVDTHLHPGTFCLWGDQRLPYTTANPISFCSLVLLLINAVCIGYIWGKGPLQRVLDITTVYCLIFFMLMAG